MTCRATASSKPAWFHHKGRYAKMRQADRRESMLLIGSDVAHTIVQPNSPQEWLITWVITHASGQVKGSYIFDHEQLAAAFGLVEHYGEPAWLSHYDADAGEQGLFIRRGNFLNIPCPGTGHDGDPNISIFVLGVMRDHIRALLGR